MEKHPIMSMQQQFTLLDEILQDRLEHLLPKLMEETGTQMWIVIGDEYNEGPCVKSFLPSSFFHARRTAAFIFTCEAGKVERMIVSKPDFSIDRFYTPVLLKPEGFDYEKFYTTFASGYDLEKIRAMKTENLWSCMNRIIAERDPEHIAIDISGLTPFSDGLSKTNYDHLIEHIDPCYHDRFTSAERITMRWLETRTGKELELQKRIVETTRQIIGECYSREVITPGKTTTGAEASIL